MLSDNFDILKVEVSAPTSDGRLFYFFDPEIDDDLLYLRGITKKRPTYCINLGGAQALFDIDSNKTLSEAEFVQPRKSWIVQAELIQPKNYVTADIRFTNVSEYHHFIDIDVSMFTVKNKDIVEIWLWGVKPIGQWVALSEHCLACVTSNYLSGFWVKTRP